MVMRMARLVLLYIWFSCAFLRSSSDANKLIVGRGYRNDLKKEGPDFFVYTNESSCGLESDATAWCQQVNAESLSTMSAISSKYKCSCVCQWDVVTFLLDERRCVNESHLRSRFGSGTFMFHAAIDLTRDSELNVTKLKFPNHCKVIKVEYYKVNNGWQEINMSISPWKMKNNGDKLKWKKSTVKEVNGRIIRIQICKQNGSQQCSYNKTVFCKSKGNSSVNIPDVDPTKPATAVTISTVSSSPIYTSNSPIYTSKSPIYTSETHFSQVSVSAIYTSQPSKESEYSNDEAASSTGVIVGVIITCIIVIIIIVVIIIWKRRKQNSSLNSSTKPTKMATDSIGNPTYQKNQAEIIALPHKQDNNGNNTGNEEYDYATLDGGPSDHQKPPTSIYESLIQDNVRDSVYAPLNKEGEETPVEYSHNHLQHPQYNPPRTKSDLPNNNAVYASLNKEATETPVEYSHNHLQHPQYNPPRTKKDTLYNTLKQPNDDSEYMEPETQINDDPTGASEPVYNVLEGPDADPAPQDNDPVYNVLEDPNVNQDPHNDEPVYNVLEDPDDDYDNAPIDEDEDDPASGQDNVAYSSTIDLNEPQSPSSPDYDVLEDPEGASPDSMYQPLGIRVQDDLYQPLDRTSQPIYQTLEPSDSTA